MSTLPEKIPGLGIGIKASNRAYAGFLDHARMDISDYYYSQFKKMGKTFETDPKIYKDLSKAAAIDIIGYVDEEEKDTLRSIMDGTNQEQQYAVRVMKRLFDRAS